MKSKVERLDSQRSESTEDADSSAFLSGLAFDELIGEFLYFLRYAPEGKQARKELEISWQQACNQARADKLLVGREWTFTAWLKEIQTQLLDQTKKEASQSLNSSKVIKKPVKAKEKKLKFKNIQ